MPEQPATPTAAVHDRRSRLDGRAVFRAQREDRPRSGPDHPFAAAVRRGSESAPYLTALARLPARAVDALLWLYQKLVSPALQVAAPSCGCRFAPTCSHYAREALREHGLLAGLALAGRRLAKCGPWHPGGLDPVPPRKFSCVNVTKITPAES